MSLSKKSINPKFLFSPSCALMLYKPELAEKLHKILNKNYGKMELLSTCCQHDPRITENTRVINVCPGCDKRFGKDYENVSTVPLWELLASDENFPFPNYNGKKMSIIDACPTRENEKVHNAIRTLLQKMNIKLEEPGNTRTNSTCCGDSFHGLVPTLKLKELMIKRTSEMPENDVVVYCISCIKSVFIGGKRPQYLVDLIFGEKTDPKTYEPDEWHKENSKYIDKH